MKAIINTERLQIRLAAAQDAGDFFRLWTNPRVMANVGFPNGLQITLEEIENSLAQEQGNETPFGRHLSVILPGARQYIGEAWMSLLDDEGIADTDVKLLPEFWGNGYGVEIKKALVGYLFTHTNAIAVRATPNVNNTASIRMQEAVGGKRVGEGVGEFPASMRSYTTPVHYYVYLVRKEDWQAKLSQE